jgi:drug/metabolite transporter (DMT)-like permease
MNDTTIGVLLNTSSQVSTTEHRLKTAALSIPRGAFLGLIRLNVWGLATLLSKKAFLVDAATTARQTAPNMWWDLQKKWRNGWWNLGGDWDKFVSAVNAGKGKKALGFKLAPKQIKEKLKSQGIGGYDSAVGSCNSEKGIGAISEATIVAASAIIVAVMPLIVLLYSNAKKRFTC